MDGSGGAANGGDGPRIQWMPVGEVQKALGFRKRLGRGELVAVLLGVAPLILVATLSPAGRELGWYNRDTCELVRNIVFTAYLAVPALLGLVMFVGLFFVPTSEQRPAFPGHLDRSALPSTGVGVELPGDEWVRDTDATRGAWVRKDEKTGWFWLPLEPGSLEPVGYGRRIRLLLSPTTLLILLLTAAPIAYIYYLWSQ